MDVRRAVVEDAPGIARAHVRSLTKAYAGILHPDDLALFTDESATEIFRKRLLDGEPVFASFVEGQIVGQARWGVDHEADWPFPAMLYTVFVHPDHQGQGHGTALIRACVTDATAQGHQGMCIGALRDNPRAWRLYERLGAVRFHAGPLRIGAHDYEEVLMSWDDLPELAARLG
ncbi:MAG: GNAT family N-acetyltransferase [Fimbriimonadaceae bacterium]|nr:GNAT family N-acetyltransferase [Fimbriimonadaceae bacterium]